VIVEVKNIKPSINFLERAINDVEGTSLYEVVREAERLAEREFNNAQV
jgi:hypothetical protein